MLHINVLNLRVTKICSKLQSDRSSAYWQMGYDMDVMTPPPSSFMITVFTSQPVREFIKLEERKESL